MLPATRDRHPVRPDELHPVPGREPLPSYAWWIIGSTVGAVVELAIGAFRSHAPDRWNIAAGIAFGVVLLSIIASGRVDFDSGTIRPGRAGRRRIADGIVTAGYRRAPDGPSLGQPARVLDRGDDGGMLALRDGDRGALPPGAR